MREVPNDVMSMQAPAAYRARSRNTCGVPHGERLFPPQQDNARSTRCTMRSTPSVARKRVERGGVTQNALAFLRLASIRLLPRSLGQNAI
jgi:hypothetical protein